MGLPFLISEHNTYISITKDYIHPSFYQSFKRKVKRQSSLIKGNVEKRNSRIIQSGHGAKWATFITLTFAPDSYWDSYNDFQKSFRSFIQSLRYYVGKFQYLAVLEHGGRTSRIHYHLLTTIPYASPIFEKAFHTRRKVCNIWDFGFSDVVPVDNKRCNAVFYLAKYLSKDSKDRTPIGKREVFSSRGLNPVKRSIVSDPSISVAGLKEYGKLGRSIIYLKPKNDQS